VRTVDVCERGISARVAWSAQRQAHIGPLRLNETPGGRQSTQVLALRGATGMQDEGPWQAQSSCEDEVRSDVEECSVDAVGYDSNVLTPQQFGDLAGRERTRSGDDSCVCDIRAGVRRNATFVWVAPRSAVMHGQHLGPARTSRRQSQIETMDDVGMPIAETTQQGPPERVG
jgi:hypothetical protein